jgi:Signal transduction histidine kinase
MNIKTKLLLGLGILAGMIVLLVSLSIFNLQILTEVEPNSPKAPVYLERALLWISVIGVICIVTGVVLWVWLPSSINNTIRKLTDGIMEIANHNYEKRLDIKPHEEFYGVSESFNRMAKRLTEYRESILADILAAKRFLEAIVNSINDPIIGLNNEKEILFINDEALTILNLKRDDVIRKSAGELALRNDLLRRLVRELITPSSNKEPLKIYADNKESYFRTSYIPIQYKDEEKNTITNLGNIIMLKNITEFKELDSAKTTFISTISHELKTPISTILMSLKLLEDARVGSLNAEQQQLSTSIEENAKRLLDITSELLNITQIENGRLQLRPRITKPIELIQYAIKANQVQADKFGIRIEVDYPEEGKIGKLFVDSEK